MTAAEFTRWFLALFFLGVAGFYTARIIVVRRRLHMSPVFMGDLGTLHWATHTAFRVFRVLILGICVARLIWPGLDAYLGYFDSLAQPAVLLTGDAILLVSFIAVLWVHFAMAEAWRSGTRAGDRTQLMVTGPFARTRNPMMLGVLAAQVGFALALPSVFSLICLVVGVWAVHAQVRVEERALRDHHGAAYEAYARRTPRWLF